MLISLCSVSVVNIYVYIYTDIYVSVYVYMYICILEFGDCMLISLCGVSVVHIHTGWFGVCLPLSTCQLLFRIKFVFLGGESGLEWACTLQPGFLWGCLPSCQLGCSQLHRVLQRSLTRPNGVNAD